MPAILYNWNKAAAIGKTGGEHGTLHVALDRVVHRYSVEAADKAKPLTPVHYGTLQKSLSAAEKWEPLEKAPGATPMTGQQVEPMVYIVGSSLPYCEINEYEHATKKMFIHKGIALIKKPMREEARAVMKVTFNDAWDGAI